jgi:hypothetical protein
MPDPIQDELARSILANEKRPALAKAVLNRPSIYHRSRQLFDRIE